MSLFSRLTNVFRGDRLIPWLDSLRADAVFGWRQLKKRKATSAAAILSLALAIGACTSAFRLIDAMLLRPLPVANPEGLYVVARQGVGPAGDYRISDSSEYPLFRRMRAAAKGQAELIAISFSEFVDVTFGSDDEMEKAHRQYVSGWMFGAFGLQPAAGRLLTENDDLTPGAHPYAVLSYDYWTRRFGRDPKAVGRKLRMGNNLYEVVGVAQEHFTGTEPGVFVDVFVPAMMNPWVGRSDASWFRPFAVLAPGVAAQEVRATLHPVMHAFDEERAKGWKAQTKQFIDRFLNQKLVLEPAASGISGMQSDYRRSLLVLGALVILVLLIACANVANLMTAQASARAREMALRVSIGAGRARLIQMVLVESVLLGLLAAVGGGLFAWWAAPLVVSRINPPDNPARLALPADWRVFAFSLVLALVVTALFGLAPALRASSFKPASALKGGDDPHARRRLMHALISVQVAFCFVVHFAAGLFVTTFDRLANQSPGFSVDGLLTLDTVSRAPQPPAFWSQITEHLRSVPGVERAGLTWFPLLSGNGVNGFVWVNGAPTEILAYYLGVSPGWIETMGIPLVSGRDIREGEAFPDVALVNEAFVRQCFGGENPTGRWFEKETGDGVTRHRIEVIGVVRDARYRNMREPITPTAYVPFHARDRNGAVVPRDWGTFVVRTASENPLVLASVLRREVARARPEFRVSNIRTQKQLVDRHTVRERLLATLALFFALVALLLAGVGLYGVLDYSVLQRQREIGIRMAIGATSRDIAGRLTGEALMMVLVGAFIGLGAGVASARYIKTLLYSVTATDPAMLLLPSVVILAATLLAAFPAVLRAVRTDPVAKLRGE